MEQSEEHVAPESSDAPSDEERLVDQAQGKAIAGVADLGHDKPLYILAFDHRGSFQKKMLGIEGTPSEEDARRIADAKKVIFEGFQQAVADGAPKDAAGLLVDEQFGGDIARAAKQDGYNFAMPVEKSGQDEFDFDYGEEFGQHILDFDPTFSKVLVRYNPDGDPELNSRQLGRLKMLSDWLHANGRRFLFELLVPAEPSQLEAVGGGALMTSDPSNDASGTISERVSTYR